MANTQSVDDIKPSDTGLGRSDQNIYKVSDHQLGASLLDKLSRIDPRRRIKPIDKLDYIRYPHRVYDECCLGLGDSYFMIPPEFIHVTSESTSVSTFTLRQENSMKEKFGHRKRTILIDLVFNGYEQINGYKMPGPDKDYYVDGLRQLLAQFKCAPFLPIQNILLNQTYGIMVVVLQDITIETVEGFPNMMQAHLVLQEANMEPYLEAPDVVFKDMIDWDLFRYYYQSFLTEDHTYKRLQSLPVDKNYNHFKMSILDYTAVNEYASTTLKNSSDLHLSSSFMDIVTEKLIISDTGSNYKTWISSDDSDVHIAKFNCGYSNILVNLTMSKLSTPVVQYLGGRDTKFEIAIETTDLNVVSEIEKCQIQADSIIRDFPKLHTTTGFVKLESELVEFVGSLFVMIDSVTTSTVPGFPGLYQIIIDCVSYDIAQSEREELDGFMPFDHNEDDETPRKDQVIHQSLDGLETKIRQDFYAEDKLRQLEVYPDLRLPTYEELNSVISKIRKFRSSNGLTQLEYKEYPINPSETIYGNEGQLYSRYVDPDFYVFYPISHLSLVGKYETKLPEISSFTKTVTTPNLAALDTYEQEEIVGQNIDDFVEIAKNHIGCSYKVGGIGDTSDINGPMFDSIGLVSYALKKSGIIETYIRDVKELTDNFRVLDEGDSKKRGDILINKSNNTAAIYLSLNKYIYVNKKKGVHTCSAFSYQEEQVVRLDKKLSLLPNSDPNLMNGASGTSDAPSYIWNYFLSRGYSEIAVAGILGNLMQESGVRSNNVENSKEGTVGSDADYTKKVDDGTISAESFMSDKAGYGIAQFTYPTYKKQLYDLAKAQGKSISDVDIQCQALESQLAFLKSSLNACKYVDEASTLVLTKYERPANPSATQSTRAEYARQFYNQFAGKKSPDTNSSAEDITISESEFYDICAAVNNASKGQPTNAILAASQLVYDRLTDPQGRWAGNVAVAINDLGSDTGYNESVINYVSDVLQRGTRFFSTSCAYYTTKDASLVSTYDNMYDRLESVGNSMYWGDSNLIPSSAKIIVSADAQSGSGHTREENVNIGAYNIDKDKFAVPVTVETDKANDKNSGSFWEEEINNSENTFNTSFCDMYQYSARGRLLRAFPAYLMCILDEGNNQWYRADKLWTNYYAYKSVVSITTHGTNDMPIETAEIVVNNVTQNLSRLQTGLSSYNILDDPEIFGPNRPFRKWLYQTTGINFGMGPKLTSMMIQLHQVLYTHAKLRPGARMHFRMGYGSDPLNLAPVMNGLVNDVSMGSQIDIIISSDGNELINVPVSAKEKDTNNGWLGLFGLGEDQEGDAIIADFLCKRQSFLNKVVNAASESSKFCIEHYGLYFSNSMFGPTDSIGSDIANVANIGTAVASSGSPGIALTNLAASYAVQKMFNINLTGYDAGEDISISDGNRTVSPGSIGAFTGLSHDREQLDILRNIYRANYRGRLYLHDTGFGMSHIESNLAFCKYNMTPWDVGQTCAQNYPEFIIKTTYHQFDSRLYFGLPLWMERYRYSKKDGTLVDECKTAAQVHFVDSMDSIIDNQVRASSKSTNTNIKVIYTRGKKATPTMTIHSDDTIDNSKQKTKILDTAVTQNALGPDLLYEWLQYKVGHDTARRIGISNLIYGWNEQYQGSLILTGSPGIKAGDYILLNDTYSDMFGMCLVREVLHTFSPNEGYTTTVVPGMLAFSTDQTSGMIEKTISYIDLLSSFATYTDYRYKMYAVYEANIGIYGALSVIDEMSWSNSDLLQGSLGLVRGASQVASVGLAANYAVGVGRLTWDVIRGAKTLKEVADVGRTALQTLKTMKTVTSIAKGGATLVQTLNTIEMAGIAGAPVSGGTSLLVTAAAFIVSTLLDRLVEYISNKNVIGLIPLWWQGYPFATNVKGGKYIVLTQPFDTDEDESDAKTLAEH